MFISQDISPFLQAAFSVLDIQGQTPSPVQVSAIPSIFLQFGLAQLGTCTIRITQHTQFVFGFIPFCKVLVGKWTKTSNPERQMGSMTEYFEPDLN